MKNMDEAMERVLAGLRDADAPVGIERRIQKAIEDRAVARSQGGWRRLRPVWLTALPGLPAGRLLACGVAMAILFLVALTIPVTHWPERVPAPVASRTMRNPASVEPLHRAASATVATRAQLSSAEPDGGLTEGSQSRVRMRRAARVLYADRDAGRYAGRDGASVALSEMRAASHPAPPLPLTEQEKLLSRIVHKGDPVELAMLDPERRDRQLAEDKADFQRFFEPPTIQNDSTGENK